MITCACFVMCECVSSESMYKVTEHKCEVLWYIFCQINIKIVFDVARYENLDQKFILFAPLIIDIFLCILNVCTKIIKFIFSALIIPVSIMFFLDP